MVASRSRSKKMSVEEYIRYEEISPVRHEFINGKLIEMPGTTDRHNDICYNINHHLRVALQMKNKRGRVYQESVKSQLIDGKRYTYPDIFVTCDERDLADRYIKRFPIAIFEVSSNSTKVFDKTGKFIEFQQIESLQHYIIVDSESVFVEIFSRDELGKWTKSQVLHQLSDVLQLTALGLDLPLTDIYAEQ